MFTANPVAGKTFYFFIVFLIIVQGYIDEHDVHCTFLSKEHEHELFEIARGSLFFLYLKKISRHGHGHILVPPQCFI